MRGADLIPFPTVRAVFLNIFKTRSNEEMKIANIDEM